MDARHKAGHDELTENTQFHWLHYESDSQGEGIDLLVETARSRCDCVPDPYIGLDVSGVILLDRNMHRRQRALDDRAEAEKAWVGHEAVRPW